MEIAFILDDNENEVTPIKIANALIDATKQSKQFPEKGLKEIVAYLSVYTRYNGEGKR